MFVAATANRIEYLPAEMIRKGRFDQVFFVDPPDEDERRELIAIHLRHNGANPEDFNLDTLAGEILGCCPGGTATPPEVCAINRFVGGTYPRSPRKNHENR